MPKVKSKSTTPGRTKKRRTGRTTSRKPAKRSGTKKHPVSLGARKYYVPQKVFLKLLEDLEPHRSKEEELLSFEKFFEADQADIPKWATYLRGLRYREDLTQAEFAAAIGVPQSNLSAMENGKRAIGKELAKRIADTFQTNYRYLL